MTTRARLFVWGLALTAAGCGPDSVVVITVTGPSGVAIDHFDGTVSVGADSRQLRIPEGAHDPIFLPTSFTVQIPRDRSGTLRVTLTAFDKAGQEIARGTGTLASLDRGRNQELLIMLGEVRPDGGVPDGGRADAQSPDVALAERAPDAASVDDAADDSASPDVAEDVASDTPSDLPVDRSVDAPRDGSGDARDASDAPRDGGGQ